jgi:hypothetical protein
VTRTGLQGTGVEARGGSARGVSRSGAGHAAEVRLEQDIVRGWKAERAWVHAAVESRRTVRQAEVVVTGVRDAVAAGVIGVDDDVAVGARGHARSLTSGRREVATIGGIEQWPVDFTEPVAADHVVP